MKKYSYLVIKCCKLLLKSYVNFLFHMGDGKGLSDHNTDENFLIKLDR